MRLRRWFLDDRDTLVRIKSLRPSIGKHGVEWPTMLVDRRGLGRITITPVWDRLRLALPWTRET